MAIRRDTVSVTAGGDGTGSAVTSRVVDGAVLAVYAAYDGAASTTDLIIAEANNSPALPVLTVTDSNTDGWFYPRIALNAVADGAAIDGPVDYQSVSDSLRVSITGADEGDVITATILWDDLQ